MPEVTKEKLQSIGERFRLSGEIETFVKLNDASHNLSYKVIYTTGKIYMFQRIAPTQGVDIEKVMHNVDLVSEYLRKKRLSSMHFHHTDLKTNFVKDEDGEYWRVLKFYDCELTEDRDLKTIEGIGRAIASFQLSLLDFDVNQLEPTFVDRHNTRKYFAVLENDGSELYQYLKANEDKACEVYDAFLAHEIPVRVADNHTKIQNVLLDKDKNPVTIIDLDCVMPGIAVYDFATAAMSACKVNDGETFDLEKFEAFINASLPIAKTYLTKKELSLIYPSLFAVIVEASAFNYRKYQLNHHDNRLAKAKRYQKLAIDLESKKGQIEALIEKANAIVIKQNILLNAFDREGVDIHSQTDYEAGEYMNVKIPHKIKVKGGKCYAFFKRFFDIVCSLLAIIVLSPLLFVTGLIVKFSSPGPMIYVSKRVGMNGKVFRFYKFRSMYNDADKRLDELLAKNEVEGGITFKMKDDPRVTPFGKFIRKTSIDELPQLFNILKGDMSIIGPRAGLPREVKLYPEEALDRLLVPQGLSGEWQANGRSDTTFEGMIKLDLDYIQNKRSFWHDVGLIFKTIGVVFTRKGAE